MERFCLDCNSILKGRTDKKYCDDQCRSNYNNRIRSEDLSIVKQINIILRKNRQILIHLNPAGKTKVVKDLLLKKGFDFSYFTHTYATQKGNIYYFCYEYGYLILEENQILLVKKE